MATLIEIDVERKIVFTTCFGIVTDAEFVAAREQVLTDPQFDPSFDRLWDFSGVTAEQVSEETLAHLVKTSPSHGNIARAVVVSMNPQALTRVLEFVSQSRRYSRRMAAFPTREAAQHWIESERRGSAAGRRLETVAAQL